MSITFDLPVQTDHSTAGPPVAPVLYQYYRGGSLQRKGLPNEDNDGLYAYDDTEHVHAVTGYRDNTYGYDARACHFGKLSAGSERRPKVA